MNKILCITGTPSPALEQVTKLLTQAGLSIAQATDDGKIDMDQWHRKVAAKTTSPRGIGRLWEGLAADLLLANAEQPCWGWRTPFNRDLLDFWADFETDIHFLLLTESSDQAVSRWIAGDDNADAAAEVPMDWQSTQRALMDFNLQWADRCLLVDAQQALNHPEAFIGLCEQRLEMPLQADKLTDSASAPLTTTEDILARYLGQQLSQQKRAALDAIRQELELACVPISEATDADNAEPAPEASLQDALGEYRALRDQRQHATEQLETLQQQLHSQQQQQNQAEQANKTKLAELNQQISEHKARIQTLVKQNQQLDKSKAEADQALKSLQQSLAHSQASSDELKQENELILLQLHQIQEELESTFLASEQQKETDAAARKQLQQQVTEQQGRIQTLEKQSQQKEAAKAEAFRKRQSLEQSLKQSQASSDQLKQAVKDSQKRIQSLESALSEAKSKAGPEQQALRNQVNELQQENDLLLLQLHQVQEELEHLFLEKQKIEAEAQGAGGLKETLAEREEELKESRDAVQRLREAAKQTDAAREKALKESQLVIQQLRGEAVQAEKALATKQDKIEKLTKALDASGKAVQLQRDQAAEKANELHQKNKLLQLKLHQVEEELDRYFHDYQTQVNWSRTLEERWERMLKHNPSYCDYQDMAVTPIDIDGLPAFSWRFDHIDIAGRSLKTLSFDTQVKDDVLQLRFKHGEAGAPLMRWPETAGQYLVVHPKAQPADWQLLGSLATSDWHLVQGMAELVHQNIPRAGLADEQQKQQLDATEALQQALQTVPDTFRFDQAKLRNLQINPDYEHIWLDLSDVKLNGEPPANWSVRLSCANVAPGRFGSHPKIEFPEGEGQRLESWYPESHDDFGDKLELRFALPGAMDVNVWSSLSEADQQRLASLIDALPTLLQSVEASGADPQRDWQEWYKLVEDIRQIHRTVCAA